MRMFNLFRRKTFKPEPKSLRIDGVKTVMTPVPDDAELAAQALLETLASEKRRVKSEKNAAAQKKASEPMQGTPEYYKQLSEKMRKAKAAEVRQTKRFLTYAEQQLDSPLMTGQTGEIENELYKLQDVAEREGGELLKRWRHCLAECIVRQMSKPVDEQDLQDSADSRGDDENKTE